MVSQYLRHLAKIGLDKHAAIIPLSTELKRLIPSYSFSFFWTDNNGKIISSYDDSAKWSDHAFDFFDRFCPKFTTQPHSDLAQWHLKNNDVVLSQELFSDQCYTSGSYLGVWKQLNYNHSIIASVKRNNIPVGILMLHRKASEQPYNSNDKKQLKAVLPLIADGLSCCGQQGKLSSTDTFGTMIVNDNAIIEYFSPSANRLLFMCANFIASKQARNVTNDDIQHLLEDIFGLCHQLQHQWKDKPTPTTAKFTRTSPAGGLTFTASWLQVPEGQKGLICVNVLYQEPQEIKILNNCLQHALTTRQIDVCLRLCQSKTYEQIATELYISVHTVIDHMRKIYEKLKVVSRNEVIQQLTLVR